MTKAQAKKLEKGCVITVIQEDPTGGETEYKPFCGYIPKALKPGDRIVFDRIIPKVRVVKNGPWHDKFPEMLFGHMENDMQKRAWINISNAKIVENS